VDFRDRIHASFDRQVFMRRIGATLDRVEAGEVEISLPFAADLVQHTGVLHAGVVTALVDTACGYAAYTMMAEHEEVLSIEFKMNFLRPASGERFVAVGRVVKAGSTIIATQGDVFAQAGAVRDHVAMMVATMIRR